MTEFEVGGEFEAQIDSIIRHSNRTSEFRLWLRVTIDAFFALHNNCGNQDMARSWIFDPGNVLFDFIAEELGYSPETLRKRIREALKRSRSFKRIRTRYDK